MASSTTVAIIATSITVCLAPVGAGSFLDKDTDDSVMEHMEAEAGPQPALSVSRVNGLSTLSKLHGVDKRGESHRPDHRCQQ
jgi:hypothetical protein